MNFAMAMLSAVGGSAVLLTALAFLTRSLLRHWMDKDVEVFKADLRAKETEATEKLKASLQLASVEHQIQFSRLHERRADVIERVYELLLELMWSSGAACSIVRFSGGKSQEELLSEADTQRVELFRYFMKNRIFLPAAACESLETFIEDTRQRLIKFGVYLDVNEYAPPEVLKEKRDQWIEAHKYFSEGVKEALTELEKAFRAILDPQRSD